MVSIPPMKDLLPILFDEKNCIEFLFEQGILTIPSNCQACGGRMTLHDKQFRCTRKLCRMAVSIYRNTFFFESRLKCNEVLHLGYLWLTRCPADALQVQSGHSSETICNYRRHFRELVTTMIDTDDVIIGGPGIVVQIDETKLGKRKYHRGHLVEGSWVIVGVEKTEARLVFAEAVPNRSAETIAEVLSRHIAEGSIIHTDMWKGYSSLAETFELEHHTVNHSLWFKDPVTGIDTNTVEGTNYAIKRFIEPRNRTEDSLPLYLTEFIWRRKNQNTLFNSFIDALKCVGYLEHA